MSLGCPSLKIPDSGSISGRAPTRKSAAMLDQIAREVRAARHHMRDGCAIILVARTVALEKIIEALDTLWHCRNGLQTDRNAVVRKGEFGVGKIRLPTEIALLAPHIIEYGEATFPL